MMTAIPLASDEPEWDEEFARTRALDGVRVLVVDDDADARAAIAAVLEACNARVTAVGSAAEALGAIRTLRPDVLVSDIAMPGMDGHRLIRRVRSLDVTLGGATPAAAVTAFATNGDRMRALLDGYQVYLAKPFDPPELIALVARLARRPLDD